MINLEATFWDRFRGTRQSLVAIAVSVTLLAGILLAPAFVAAADRGIEACDTAVKNGVSTQGYGEGATELKFLNEGYVLTESQYAAGEYLYDLIAIDNATGQIKAWANCGADESGRVTSLTMGPATNEEAARLSALVRTVEWAEDQE